MKLARLVAAAVLAAAAGALFVPATAEAHGAIQVPGSRTWFCYQDGRNPTTGAIEPKNPACAAAVAKSGVTSLYNWFAVLRSDGAGRVSGFIPDGQLCSGGTGGPYDFTGYNLARDDWPTTHLTAGATMEFHYNDWAKHPGTFSLYITKDGYDPTRPLAWSDLEPTPFDTVTNPPADGGPGTDAGHYYWTGKLPSGKSGKHLIYSVWSRSDSTETFYGCSDVVFDGGNGQVTGIGTPPSSPPPSSPSASPSTPGGGTGSGCSAMYNVTSSWTGGFQAQVMVHAGTTAVNGWHVSWTWPGGQTLASLWSGRATSTGSLVSVTNETWNGTIAAGDHTTFGFLGSGSAPATVPNLTCTSGS
ncbi:chitin-binding protein [Actinoplanes sp. SE50]|uniref:lytic polysaccharide monooxygenase auxiliary activity family 9 protein n=1 Tax=unclassified Actinoplanes TaxID=2626549 RepID=UPI00023EBED3|nr:MULTISPECIES: lytic polysaccharide monooxygenase [unclassified Actinoplanes]AEV83479.1 GlcNAc-binding protein A [Actinoplanes sp. SE50/110]ATO81872.1 chitin-binding protein [Actinoplanes sp. SE50]SLL99280.1 chitin-binding protein [Actinoplanes sp. SE50/110]